MQVTWTWPQVAVPDIDLLALPLAVVVVRLAGTLRVFLAPPGPVVPARAAGLGAVLGLRPLHPSQVHY